MSMPAPRVTVKSKWETTHKAASALSSRGSVLNNEDAVAISIYSSLNSKRYDPIRHELQLTDGVSPMPASRPVL